MTSTAKRRKEKLKERSRLRLDKKRGKGKQADADVPEFHMSETGHLRPSDLGGPDDFKGYHRNQFGEQSDRPPELSSFTEKFRKAEAPHLVPGYQALVKNSDTITTGNGAADTRGKSGVGAGAAGEGASQRQSSTQRKKKVKISDRWDLDGDDGLETGGFGGYGRGGSSGGRWTGAGDATAVYGASGGSGVRGGSAEGVQALVRAQAQAAYRQLRADRHKHHKSVYTTAFGDAQLK